MFGRDFNEALVHQIVVAYQANARPGTRAQKDREDGQALDQEAVAPEGHRPRARRHDLVSPIWRGGGRTFPNLPDENFSHKVNKKMYRAGMTSILSKLAREDRIAVVDGLAVDSPKTKSLAAEAEGDGTASRC